MQTVQIPLTWIDGHAGQAPTGSGVAGGADALEPPIEVRQHGVVRRHVADAGIDDLICSRVRPAGTATAKRLVPLGMRWPIGRTNSRLSNFGQLRRNTDRRPGHRLAQLALAVALLLTAKLIDWRNRWSPA